MFCQSHLFFLIFVFSVFCQSDGLTSESVDTLFPMIRLEESSGGCWHFLGIKNNHAQNGQFCTSSQNTPYFITLKECCSDVGCYMIPSDQSCITNTTPDNGRRILQLFTNEKEKKNALIKAFSLADTHSGDRKLDFHEFSTACGNLGIYVGFKEKQTKAMRRAFYLLDIDFSGFVDLEEFIEGFTELLDEDTMAIEKVWRDNAESHSFVGFLEVMQAEDLSKAFEQLQLPYLSLNNGDDALKYLLREISVENDYLNVEEFSKAAAYHKDCTDGNFQYNKWRLTRVEGSEVESACRKSLGVNAVAASMEDFQNAIQNDYPSGKSGFVVDGAYVQPLGNGNYMNFKLTELTNPVGVYCKVPPTYCSLISNVQDPVNVDTSAAKDVKQDGRAGRRLLRVRKI